MGLFKKVRDILFDEEEYTEQIKITPEMRNEETPLKEEVVAAEKKAEVREETVVKPQTPVAPKTEVSERELFKSDTTFPFFDFDEEEFDKQMPAKARVMYLNMNGKRKLKKGLILDVMKKQRLQKLLRERSLSHRQLFLLFTGF